MRAGIGLVGLLVTVGLMVWLFATLSLPTAKVGKQAQNQAQQISGRGEDGAAASDTFATDGSYKGSRFEGLTVTTITAGGAMDAYFGLRPGDTIIAIQGTKLADTSNGDEELAKALVAEAFSKKQTLSVRRNGRGIDLPLPAGSTVPPLTGAPAPAQPPQQASAPSETPPNPALAPAQAPRRQGGLERQLDAIQDAAGK